MDLNVESKCKIGDNLYTIKCDSLVTYVVCGILVTKDPPIRGLEIYRDYERTINGLGDYGEVRIQYQIRQYVNRPSRIVGEAMMILEEDVDEEYFKTTRELFQALEYNASLGKILDKDENA